MMAMQGNKQKSFARLQVKIRLPPKLIPLFAPKRGELRFRAAYGGRGSGKSFSFAQMALVFGACEKLRVLCTRELQDSIKDSFFAELKAVLETNAALGACYEVGADYLRGKNGTEFIFKGLRHNVGSIKSLAKIDICIVEEAEDVPEQSWVALDPTIRAPKSEIWVLWNPKKQGSPVDKRLIQNPPPRSMVVKINHTDNPWFPKVLDELRIHQLKHSEPEVYAHIWDGAYLENSAATIFKGCWQTDDFEAGEDWDGPYYGLDFGFSQDPTASVRCWVHDKKLWIDYEAGGVGIELDDTAPKLIKEIPGIARHAVYADNARPESISYLARHGLPRIAATKKWQGSVEDGIAHIKSYDKVIIHTRCANVRHEFCEYSYKVDRNTGDILPVIVDKDNHYIDAIRYAIHKIHYGRLNISNDAIKNAMRRNK